MARRNLLRSLLAASLSVAAATTALVAAASAIPAGAAGNGANLYQVTLSEKNGFSPGVIDVRVGDYIAFVLDTQSSASDAHSVTWDDTNPCPNSPNGTPCWPELRFNDPNQACTLRNYVIPNTRCVVVREAGAFRYHDRLWSEAGGTDFQGLVRVAGPATGPPTTTTTAPPTTTTTARPTTTTTWSTTTTEPGSVHPLLIENSDPTTTTTERVAAAPVAGAGTNKSGAGVTTTTAPAKPKSAVKPDPPAAAATPAPAVAPGAPLLDAAALTPGPVTLPETVAAAGPTNSADLDGSVLSLLNRDAPVDNGSHLLVIALAALAVLLVVLGGAAWYHRSSRYFPA